MTTRQAAGVAFASALLVTTLSLAVQTDRVAIERFDGESPWDAAFEYERACWQLGAEPSYAHPVQTFSFDERQFVRLAVDGDELSTRCLEQLPDGRRGVDGSVHWFDGFQGGVLVPSGARVPDAVWYAPGSRLDAPKVDPELVESLTRSDPQALATAKGLNPAAVFALVQALTARAGVTALPALEQLASTHPHWRARRAATEALDVNLSYATLEKIARSDEAWEVRHAAVGLVGLAASAPLARVAPHEQEAAQTLDWLLANDAAWQVRRQAIWRLSSAVASTLSTRLLSLSANDDAPQVRAAALEVLAGVDKLPRTKAHAALTDPSAIVRATAAHILVVLFDPDDAPLLWSVMLNDARAVRLAAAPMLVRVHTKELGAKLWRLYVEEAQEVDARTDVLAVFADALARADYPDLGGLLEGRLEQTLAPAERRMLAGLLARVAPTRALAIFEPLLSSDDEQERSIAAQTVPDTPSTRQARLNLLADASWRVRSAAILGLCAVPGLKLSPEQTKRVDLPPVGLGRAAALALAHCGQVDPEPARAKVALEEVRQRLPNGAWPALAAIALIAVSFVGIRLGRARS